MVFVTNVLKYKLKVLFLNLALYEMMGKIHSHGKVIALLKAGTNGGNYNITKNHLKINIMSNGENSILKSWF